MAIEWILALAGLALTLTVWGAFVFGRRRDEAREPAQVRHIRIDGSYRPSEVHIAAGVPARLIFRREETAPCSERVVFPDYGISVMLPAFEDVAVDLPASEPGEHEFTCQMEMLHGRLIVDGVRLSSRERAEAQAR
ncbi:MAG: cupredoxin domain-containing protein [Solirubrobacteraceae bacterium]